MLCTVADQATCVCPSGRPLNLLSGNFRHIVSQRKRISKPHRCAPLIAFAVICRGRRAGPSPKPARRARRRRLRRAVAPRARRGASRSSSPASGRHGAARRRAACYSAYVFDADQRANLLTSVESIGSKFGAEQPTGLDRAPFAPGRPEKGILAPRRPRLPRDWQTRVTAHHWPPRRPLCWKHRPPCPPPAPRSAGPPRRKSRRPNPGARVFARASASKCYSARKFDPLNQGISTGYTNGH